MSGILELLTLNVTSRAAAFPWLAYQYISDSVAAVAAISKYPHCNLPSGRLARLSIRIPRQVCVWCSAALSVTLAVVAMAAGAC